MGSRRYGSYVNQITRVRILGLDYYHLSLPDGEDLYLTEHGLPFLESLLPANFWTDKKWFESHSKKLRGTSTLYKVTTKELEGKSKDIVIKWNRMGQDIPGFLDVNEFNVEFNSPFEEFSLVTELRNARYESAGCVFTHKPLAIYVPPEHVDLDKLGRKAYKMKAIMSKHSNIELNMFRNYAVIYEWIKGIDAVQAFERGALEEKEIAELTLRSDKDIRYKGFIVGDLKPHHVIVRPGKNGGLTRDHSGQILYALIDFELLKRTPEHEKVVRASKRKGYLQKQAHRFEDREPTGFPSNLKPVRIMGVDYIYGSIKGTGGALWVVGKDPTLFDYFLPEKWRDESRIRLSVFDQIYRTTTKDNIHLVWKVSRVGELPDIDPISEKENKILNHGYNSPFEEFTLAFELNTGGIATTYPRAIYMAANRSAIDNSLWDDSRYKSHGHLITPDGEAILMETHDYIIFYGFWNGPDELLAVNDDSPYQGVDAILAHRKGLLDNQTYLHLLQIARDKLAAVGVEDLNLKGNHILLSVDNSGQLVKDRNGIPQIRISNFELLRKT